MRKWNAILKDGRRVSEDTVAWNSIKNDIEYLELDNNGQKIILPKGLEYIQGKSASSNLSNGECKIESRYLGFYANKTKIIIRVNELTNNISIELT